LFIKLKTNYFIHVHLVHLGQNLQNREGRSERAGRNKVDSLARRRERKRMRGETRSGEGKALLQICSVLSHP